MAGIEVFSEFGFTVQPSQPSGPPLLVGLTGRKRSGKSTVARILCERHGFVELSFANPIREFVARLLWPNGTGALERNKEAPIDWLDGITPRQMMQTLGTEWGRQMVHPDLWVRACMHRLEYTRCPRIVISDVRFPNEAKAIRERGGVIVEVWRDEAPTGDDHISEAGLPRDLIDVTQHNEGPIADLPFTIETGLMPVISATARERQRA